MLDITTVLYFIYHQILCFSQSSNHYGHKCVSMQIFRITYFYSNFLNLFLIQGHMESLLPLDRKSKSIKLNTAHWRISIGWYLKLWTQRQIICLILCYRVTEFSALEKYIIKKEMTLEWTHLNHFDHNHNFHF